MKKNCHDFGGTTRKDLEPIRDERGWKRIAAVVLLVAFAGCSGPGTGTDKGKFAEPGNASSRPLDDGEAYSVEGVNKFIKAWREDCRKSRNAAMKNGFLYDAGGPDKIVVVQVVDLEGAPLPQATMIATLYYEGEDGPNISAIKADEQGVIRYHCPFWFGPDRKETYVVSAPGYKSRRVVKFTEHATEESKQYEKARMEVLSEWEWPRELRLKDLRRGPAPPEHRAKIMLENE